jgi:hypothetical protein
MFRLFASILFVVPGFTLGHGSAPLSITFDHKISQCENKWFVAESRDGDNLLGFVYMKQGSETYFRHGCCV